MSPKIAKWGFKDKQDAIALERLAKRERSKPNKTETIQFPDRLQNTLRAIVAVPISTITAATIVSGKLVLGSGLARMYNRDQDSPNDLIQHLHTDGLPVEETVYNLCSIAFTPTGPADADPDLNDALFCTQDLDGDYYITHRCDITGTGLPTCTDVGQLLYCDGSVYVLTDPPTEGDGYFFDALTGTVKPGPVPFPAQLWWSEKGAGAEIRNATLVPGSAQTVLASGEDVTETMTAEAFNRKVYWGNDTDAKIRRVDFDGLNKEDVVNLAAGSAPIHSLEFFPENDFLYWFRGTRITRAEAITVTNLGENVSPVLSQTGSTSGFLTIAKFDGVNSIFYSRFFGTSSTISRVAVASTPTDWSPVVLRTTGGSNIMFAMAINEPTNEIFWFEKNTGAGNVDLKRGTLEASSITGVTTPVAGLVSGSNFEIKIDGINQRIIFTGELSGDQGILSCNFDGSDIRLLHSLTGVNRATGIELIDDTVIAAIEAITPVTDQLKTDVDINRGLILLMS